MAALKLVDDITTGIDNRKTAAAIFIDLSKAFDTIDHNILSDKLSAYSVRGIDYRWFVSYLKGRQHYVQFGNSLQGRIQDSVIRGARSTPLSSAFWTSPYPPWRLYIPFFVNFFSGVALELIIFLN